MNKTIRIAGAVVILSLSACAVHPGTSVAEARRRAASFDFYYQQGLTFLEQGEFGKAAAQFRAATEVKPDSAKAQNYLGLCYFRQKNYRPARDHFEKAVALDPKFASAYNNLAGTYSLELQFEQAKAMFKKALGLAPNMISANYSLGMLMLNLGEREEGSRYLSRGIALDPDYLEKHKETVASFSATEVDLAETFFACAALYAAAGNAERTADYLHKAEQAGFRAWDRILKEKEFDKVRDDPRVKEFLKQDSIR